ncbi:MAG: hypothetical protein MHM6MM_002039 [Cercozoa sp. M6MM]
MGDNNGLSSFLGFAFSGLGAPCMIAHAAVSTCVGAAESEFLRSLTSPALSDFGACKSPVLSPLVTLFNADGIADPRFLLRFAASVALVKFANDTAASWLARRKTRQLRDEAQASPLLATAASYDAYFGGHESHTGDSDDVTESNSVTESSSEDGDTGRRHNRHAATALAVRICSDDSVTSALSIEGVPSLLASAMMTVWHAKSLISSLGWSILPLVVVVGGINALQGMSARRRAAAKEALARATSAFAECITSTGISLLRALGADAQNWQLRRVSEMCMSAQMMNAAAETLSQLRTSLLRNAFPAMCTWSIVTLRHLPAAAVPGIVSKAVVGVLHLVSLFKSLRCVREGAAQFNFVRSLQTEFEPEVIEESKADDSECTWTGVSLHNVTFAYPSRPERPVLKNVTLPLRAGTVTALVGPSGGGKSTLTKLLLRFYSPQQGSVTASTRVTDDSSTERVLDLDTQQWRRHIALVPQDPSLFSMSTADNLRLADTQSNASPKQLHLALEQAHVRQVIDELPHGQDECLHQRGQTLSGGERQRLALARAWMRRDAQLVILDEPTSALDGATEQSVLRQVREMVAAGAAVVIVAHRHSTVKEVATHVAVLDKGEVVAHGLRDEVLRNRAFLRLFGDQVE